MLTVTDLKEKHGLSDRAARALMKKLPAARLIDTGTVKRWEAPDEAEEAITEDLLEEAREAAAQSPPPGPTPGQPPSKTSDPALLLEELAVKRERLAADRARAEADRLRAEVERTKAAEDLDRIRGRERTARPEPDGLADRLSSLERKIEEATKRPDSIGVLAEVLMKRPDATATLGEILKTLTPVLAPVFERLATPPPAPPQLGPQPFGPGEFLGLAEKLRGLIVSSPEAADFREEIRRAYRDGLDDGRERAGSAGGEESVVGVLRGLAEAIPQAVRTFAEIRGQAVHPMPQAPRALPQEGQGGVSTMAVNTAFQEILTALAAELGKPDRDLPGIGSFLDTITLNPTTGETMLDLLDKLSQAPERLALVSLKAWAPGLMEPAVLPGVKALLAHLREEAARAAEEEAEGAQRGGRSA